LSQMHHPHNILEREGKVIFSFVQHNLNDIGMFVRF
jgi:hypothetical protein